MLNRLKQIFCLHWKWERITLGPNYAWPPRNPDEYYRWMRCKCCGKWAEVETGDGIDQWAGGDPGFEHPTVVQPKSLRDSVKASMPTGVRMNDDGTDPSEPHP